MNDYNYLPLDDHTLGFDQVQNYLQYRQHVSITFRAHEKIETCRNYLDKKIAESDTPFYGINTGFGFLQNVIIADDQLEQLQNNLLMSHACGMGDEVPQETQYFNTLGNSAYFKILKGKLALFDAKRKNTLIFVRLK